MMSCTQAQWRKTLAAQSGAHKMCRRTALACQNTGEPQQWQSVPQNACEAVWQDCRAARLAGGLLQEGCQQLQGIGEGRHELLHHLSPPLRPHSRPIAPCFLQTSSGHISSRPFACSVHSMVKMLTRIPQGTN